MAELHDTPSRWLLVARAGLDEGTTDQLVPFHLSAKFRSQGSYWQPTAVQKLAELHDTPSRQLVVARAGVAERSTDQLVPFHLSAKFCSQGSYCVFFERGFHGASLEAVAEEAGVTKGAAYSRFESKADLFLAYQEQRNEQTIQGVAQRIAELGPGDRPVDVIIEYWRNRLLRESLAQSLLVMEFWASAWRDPEVHQRFSDQHARVLSGVAELLEEAAARRGMTLPLPALELVRLSTGIAHGLALEQLMNRDKVNAQMIELAFMPIHEHSRSAAPDATRSDGRGKRRRER